MLMVINLPVFAFHSVLDRLRGLWRQTRAKLVTRRDFFEPLWSLTRALRLLPGLDHAAARDAPQATLPLA